MWTRHCPRELEGNSARVAMSRFVPSRVVRQILSGLWHPEWCALFLVVSVAAASSQKRSLSPPSPMAVITNKSS